MNSIFKKGKLALTILTVGICGTAWAQTNAPTKQEIHNSMQKVADWQIENFWEAGHGRRVHQPTNWTNGALYVGMMKWANLSDDETYTDFLEGIGEKTEWKLGERHGLYHADEHAVGQMYLELYRKFDDEKMLEPTQKQMEYIIYHPSQSSLHWKTPYHQDRWNWCDALFMSPPVWAKLTKITGEEKYLDFMVSEFKATTDFLFDKKESLYYRDESFFDKTDNGTKIFWSRGNGWVFAGLANILEELEPGTSEHKYFVKIYKKMAKRLKELQTADGYWAMSLLGAEYYPTPETSGTGFFTFGFAWGINNGILDKEDYTPVVWKGWNALQQCVTDDGMLGYVQPIGAAPGQAWPDKTEVYGVGAYLSAGSEVYKMAQ
ncbi:glycoside hydrolase family 88 protein [Echinicola strongylocentroti]|uniref:Glycoside hydrolase family 88 protein n=1 Tax=Echinicola strongylocentroti TaxID=1795355 RepID=A0A2Z4IF26_9BACT|nr:glycoside hydrolase family 88 protein [Echinicola strongylocentroti]AWW29379.1 glycoside hydrolase family 88 protein [Echinicola strongylocentroti]